VGRDVALCCGPFVGFDVGLDGKVSVMLKVGDVSATGALVGGWFCLVEFLAPCDSLD
jgi:hypothetical protein